MGVGKRNAEGACHAFLQLVAREVFVVLLRSDARGPLVAGSIAQLDRSDRHFDGSDFRRLHGLAQDEPQKRVVEQGGRKRFLKRLHAEADPVGSGCNSREPVCTIPANRVKASQPTLGSGPILDAAGGVGATECRLFTA